MTLATDLHGYLSRRRDIVDVVDGSMFVTSVPPGISMPYVVMEMNGLDSDQTMSSASGLYTASYQITCYAEDVGTAERVADAIRLALDGYQTDDFPTVTLDAIQLDDDRMDTIYGRPGELDYTHQRTLDFTIWYRDTVPSFPAT